jgi:hypothetical protein
LPTCRSGPVPGTCGETWATIELALRRGIRGLSGGSSVARLLAERRGLRNTRNLSPLSHEHILSWADAYHRRNRGWPKNDSGEIPNTRGECWGNVDAALREGLRGLPGVRHCRSSCSNIAASTMLMRRCD